MCCFLFFCSDKNNPQRARRGASTLLVLTVHIYGNIQVCRRRRVTRSCDYSYHRSMRTCSPVCKWRCASTEHKAKQARSPPVRQHSPCCLKRLDVRHPHPPGCVGSGRVEVLSVEGNVDGNVTSNTDILCSALPYHMLAQVGNTGISTDSMYIGMPFLVVRRHMRLRGFSMDTHPRQLARGDHERRCGQMHTATGIWYTRYMFCSLSSRRCATPRQWSSL